MSTVRVAGSIYNTSGKILLSKTGSIINQRMYRNTTSTSMPSVANYVIWREGSYVKLGKKDETVLLIHACIKGNNNSSGDCGTYLECNGQKSGAFNYTYNSWANTINDISGYDVFYADEGRVDIVVGWSSRSGGAQSPFTRWNNSGGQDDSRIRPYGSTIWIQEITIPTGYPVMADSSAMS